MATKKATASDIDNHQPPTKTIAFRVPTSVYNQIQKAAKAKGEDIGTYILSQIDRESELGQIMLLEAKKAWETTKDMTKVASRFLMDLNELKEQMGMTFEEFDSILQPAMKDFLKEKKEEIQKKRKSKKQ